MNRVYLYLAILSIFLFGSACVSPKMENDQALTGAEGGIHLVKLGVLKNLTREEKANLKIARVEFKSLCHDFPAFNEMVYGSNLGVDPGDDEAALKNYLNNKPQGLRNYSQRGGELMARFKRIIELVMPVVERHEAELSRVWETVNEQRIQLTKQRFDAMEKESKEGENWCKRTFQDHEKRQEKYRKDQHNKLMFMIHFLIEEQEESFVQGN